MLFMLLNIDIVGFEMDSHVTGIVYLSCLDFIAVGKAIRRNICQLAAYIVP